MSQAYDDGGNKLGSVHLAETLKKAFDKANQEHPNASRIDTYKIPITAWQDMTVDEIIDWFAKPVVSSDSVPDDFYLGVRIFLHIIAKEYKDSDPIFPSGHS